MKRLLLTPFIFLFAISLQAQDIHFSQFFSIPSLVNPAKVGLFNGNYRFNAIYRNQWKSITTPYETGDVSCELSMASGKAHTNIAGFGLTLGSDKAGDSKLTTSKIVAAFAYHASLDRLGEQHISFGLQAGMNSSFMDYSALRFDEQFQGGGSTENFGFTSAKYFDFNSGLEYTYSRKRGNSFFVGSSIYHINTPIYSFMGNEEVRLDRKLMLNAGADINLTKRYFLYPRAFFGKQGPLTELIFGMFGCVNLTPSTKQDTRFYLGTFYRLNDAFIGMVRMDIQQLSFAFSYDFNVSKLSATSYAAGGPELSVTYKGIIPGVHHKNVNCPRF